jgi:hypothetical protein
MREEYMYESYLAQLREEIANRENQSGLPRLENRISGLPYNAEMYSKFGAYSSRASTYIEDYIHPITEDRSITPVPSDMGLTGSDSSSTLIEDIAWKIFNASADYGMLGLSDAKWKDEKEEEEHEPQQQQLSYPANDFKQSTLPEFLGIADEF